MQTTQHVLLVRPRNFQYNPETAASNIFQVPLTQDSAQILSRVQAEFDEFVNRLTENGVGVTVIEDTPEPPKPDALFPNNWVSFHTDGTVVLYPLQAKNRRPERRLDILDSLRNHFKITRIVDLTDYEAENRFLEGTGSMVFDRRNKKAFACLSPRTDKQLFIELCQRLDYQPVSIHAIDPKGKAVYHTNVMMSLGEKFAVVCLEIIPDPKEREQLLNSLAETEHQVVEISWEQVTDFAGNLLQLKSQSGQPIIVLSQRALESLTTTQKNQLLTSCKLLPLPIPTIETIGGGSVRCMIAEVFLEAITSGN